MVRDYVSGIEYSRVGSGSATIEMIHIPEGYLQNNGGSYTYHYNLTDYLGNVRATLQRTSATTGTVIQKHDYYPFGKAKAIVVSGINKYLYNGKESAFAVHEGHKRKIIFLNKSRASLETSTIIHVL